MPNDISELDLQPYEEPALDLQPFKAEPDFRRDELAKQTFQARIEGEQAKALTGLTDIAYNTAEVLSPSGLMNQPFRAAGVPDPYQAGRPLVTLPKPEGTGFMSGLWQLAAGTLEGFTSPEMLVTLPAAGASPIVRALFAGEMAKSIPEGIGIAGETLRNPEATTAQKVVATGQPLISAAFVRGLAKTPEILMPAEFNRANIPISGTAVQSPKGAIPPRGEPVAPIERVTPEQAAVAAERMSAPFEGQKMIVVPEVGPVEQANVSLTPKPSILAPEKVEGATVERSPEQPPANPFKRHLKQGENMNQFLDRATDQELVEAQKDAGDYYKWLKEEQDFRVKTKDPTWKSLNPMLYDVDGLASAANYELVRRASEKASKQTISEPPKPEVAATEPPLDVKPMEKPPETPVEAAGKGEAAVKPSVPQWEEFLSREAQRASSIASQTEGGRGIAAGAGNIEYRWKEGAMYDLRDALRQGKTLEEAAAIAKEKSKEAIKKHNARRPKDINWKRWDESMYAAVDNAVRDLNALNRGEIDITGRLIKPVEQPAQPITQGPGARTAQAVEAPESYSGTALKNAVADVERAGWGMAEAPEHIRQAIPEAWIRAGRTLERDPMAGQKLVDELAADPKGRGLSVDESALLLRQKVILSNEMNAAAEGIHTAKTPLEKARAEANYDWAHEKMLTMLDAIKNRGTAWGQEGRWRQVMAREDFSLATLITQREAALGRKILPGSPEFAELKKHADRLQELNSKLEQRVADVQAEFEASEVKRAIAEAQANANKELPYHPRILELAENYAKKWDARGAKALADLKEMFGEGQAFSGAPISPAMVDKAIIYGTSKMVRGAVDLAKWTDIMVKDLGEGFKKYAKDVFDASKKAFDQDVKNDFKKPEVERKVKGALKGADLGTVTILKQIASKSAKTKEGRLPNINYYLRKLGRVYAREGIKEEGPFLDRMTADVQKVIPTLTRDDVRAIFGGYAEEVRALSKEPVEVILRDMRGQSQELHKLSLLKQKIIPPKLQERATPSEKQRQLRKQVEAEKRTGGFAPPDPEVQLRSAMQSAETRLTNQIADLQREIDTGEKIVKQQRAPLQSEKLDALRARRDALREIHDEVFKKPDLTDAERLDIWKERIKEQIDELRDRRRRGDFKPKPKPDPIRFDKQAIELQFLKEVEHRALMEMRAKDELSKRTTPEVIKDSLKNAAMFAHMAMAGGEFSAVFKQGATGAYSMPIRTARNFAKSLQAWWSEENQFKIKHEILTRDNAPMYRRDKLEFTDVGGRLSSMEEMYMFRVMDWMKKVPGLSHYVRYMDRFQRAFSTFLNLMRADTYDAMVKEMGSSPEAGQSAANYINVATGRGSHSTARFGGSGANAIFFAPRWSISRFQYLLGQPILATKPGFKKYIVKQYGKTLLGLGSVYALGYAMGGDVDWNPTSSKFGKIQIGNRVIDPLFGLAPVMRIIAQQVTGLRKNYKGQIRPIREGGKLPIFESQIQGSSKLGPYDPSGAELMGKFAWSKLAPAPEATVSAATGENVIGEKFSVGQKLGQLVTPITYRDVFNAIKDEGVDEKTAIDLMAIFGLSSYVEKPRSTQPKW